MTEAGQVGLARVERAAPLRRIAQAPVRDGDRGDRDHVGMRVGAVDRGAGAGIAGAASRVGAVRPAVPRREEHVGARRNETAGDLVERVVGIGAVIFRRADRRVVQAVEQPPAVVDHPTAGRGAHPLDQVRKCGDAV